MIVGCYHSLTAAEVSVTEDRQGHARRTAIVAALATISGAASIVTYARAAAHPGKPAMTEDLLSPGLTTDLHDWDFLIGRWAVRHRRLKTRLAGSTEWEGFAGTCVNWPTMGGWGNVDDNVIELPGGTYYGVGVRALDAKAGHWSIWWLDSRFPGRVDPPVRGGFKDGVGTFVGDDTFNGRPIKMRFRWSKITPNSAHWDQAFSPDAGKTWETNWDMDFTRAHS